MVVINRLCLGQTLVSNAFIDTYLAPADGMFVKVYIMLLRQLTESDLSVGALARALNIPEKDVMKALFYWEEQGLVTIDLSDGKIVTLELNSPAMDRDETPGAAASAHMVTASPAAAETEKAPAASGKAPKAGKPAAPVMTDNEFRQLLYVAERFLGRTLTSSDISFITWVRDEMNFSVDLTEYLIEYCVDRGHKKLSYIKAVAIGWKEAGVTTVEEARAQVRKFDEEGVLSAAGKSPVKQHNFQERKTDLNAIVAEEMRNGAKQ